MSNTFIIAPDGSLTVEGELSVEQLNAIAEIVGPGETVNCALPLARQYLDIAQYHQSDSLDVTAQTHAVWTGDVTAGPGTRTVIQLQGCPIKCPGCYVQETHAPDAGYTLPVARLCLLSKQKPHDGITILGGEPFAQPEALLALVERLKGRGEHIVLYTGFQLEWLMAHVREAPEIMWCVDLLIDGPFRRNLQQGSGEWRGSINQRIIEHPYDFYRERLQGEVRQVFDRKYNRLRHRMVREVGGRV